MSTGNYPNPFHGNHTILGTCSICGGPVAVDTVTWSVVPPTPKCLRCGAVPKQSFGEIIPMVPAPKITTTGSWTV